MECRPIGPISEPVNEHITPAASAHVQSGLRPPSPTRCLADSALHSAIVAKPSKAAFRMTAVFTKGLRLRGDHAGLAGVVEEAAGVDDGADFAEGAS